MDNQPRPPDDCERSAANRNTSIIAMPISFSSSALKLVRTLTLRTGFYIYLLGLGAIWGDRFVNYGFFHPKKTYLWVVLFFVGVPVFTGLLAAAIDYVLHRKNALVCLRREFTWSLAVFGAVLICLTLEFWRERTMEKAGESAIDKRRPLHFGSDTPFNVLLEAAGDFDFVNGTFVKIGDRYGHWVDASQYTDEERVIMLVWHSLGIIDNGGFEYLFSGDFDGDPEYRITADAYRTVGLTGGYDAFQEAFSRFPDGKVPHKSEERIAQYLSTPEAVRESINRKHWQDGWDNLPEKKLAEFIRANLVNLGKLD